MPHRIELGNSTSSSDTHWRGFGGTSPGQILDGSGTRALRFSSGGSGNYWNVPVPTGQDGKLWKLDNISGGIVLMTVPPYLSRSAEEMMVPAEVLKADQP